MTDRPRMIAGHIPMSAQLAAEAKRIADADTAEIAAVAAILDAHFRQVMATDAPASVATKNLGKAGKVGKADDAPASSATKTVGALADSTDRTCKTEPTDTQ